MDEGRPIAQPEAPAEPDAASSLLDAAMEESTPPLDPPAHTPPEAITPPAVTGAEEEDPLRAFQALQYAVLDELREAIDRVAENTDRILGTIFDSESCRARGEMLERLLTEAPAQKPEEPAPAATEAPVEQPVARTESAAREPRALAQPFAFFAAPMRRVPPRLRPLVGIFALTLLLWIPAVRWLAHEAASNRRVRPLETAELGALSASLRSSTDEATKPGPDESR